MYKTLAIPLTFFWLFFVSAQAQERLPWVHADQYTYDRAGVLEAQELAELAHSHEEAPTQLALPLFTVTIPSSAEFGGEGTALQSYTEDPLNALREPLRAAGSRDASRAMGLLYSQDGEQLLAALGDHWRPSNPGATETLIQQLKSTYVENGNLAGGLREGAASLQASAQEISGTRGGGGSPVLIAAGLGALALVLVACVAAWRRFGAAGGSTLPEAVMQQHSSQIIRRLRKGTDPDAFDDQGYTAAIYAAGQGDVAVLRDLQGYGANLGLGTSQGETPLYYAAQHGQLKTVIYLLKHGVPVDPETVHRETPLLIAAREGHVDVVRILLEAGANVNQQDNRGWTALMIALRENHTDLMNLLLGHNVDVNLAPKDGAHALMMAVKQEDEDLVRRLVERGADVHHTDRAGMCALRIAVLRGNQAIARRLLNAGADVTGAFANKETPVECAEREGHKALAEYLKKRVKRLAACMDILEVVARGDLERIKEIVVQVPNSVNVHSKKSRWTPLLIAVRAQQLEITQTLLEHGADVHARSNEGKAAIAYAVDLDNLALVKVLLEGGARIDEVNATGVNLRDYAAAQAREAIVTFVDSFRDQQAAGHALFLAVKEDDPPKALSILKERPLCVDARTRNEKWTPLLHAARADNTPMAKLLLEYDAQVNLVNTRGMSALMYTARNGNLELARLLMTRGADVRLRSREGNTACEFALDQGHVRIVMLLQEVESQLADLSRAGLMNDAETIADFHPVDGSQPKRPDEERGRSVDIFTAIMDNDVDRAKQVLHFWPDCVNLRRGPSELTPLHMAINAGLYTVTEMLLEAGADVNALTRECKTPLYQAVARADVRLVALLLNHGARVWQIVQGQTALQVAQAAGYDDIVEELTRTPAPHSE